MATTTPKADKTRHRILRAAEKIFSKKGFRAMTVREVTREARVNLASVNYHFGSKQDLMQAVIEERFGPINRQRIALIEAARREAHPAPIALPKLIEIMVRPLFELAFQEPGNDTTVIRMIGRCMSEPTDFVQDVNEKTFAEITSLMMEELARTLPDASEADLRLCLFFTISTMIGAIGDEDRFRDVTRRKQTFEDTSEMVHRLVAYVVGGFLRVTHLPKQD